MTHDRAELRHRLTEVFNRLFEHYGPQHWWPGETWFEVMVGAVLTQSAAWVNVEKAIVSLKAAGLLSPKALREVSEQELARLIYPSGYFNVKARKLKALAHYLGSRFSDDHDSMIREDLETLRSELLAVYGIGEETADDILLYALDKPTFVTDAYTRRMFSRLGLAPEKGSYDTYHRVFMDNLPADVRLFNEYHALTVRHAKDVCKKRPLCNGCFLRDLCPAGQASAGSQGT